MRGTSWQSILSTCDDVDAMVTRTRALAMPVSGPHAGPPVLSVVGSAAVAAMPAPRSHAVLVLAEEVRARILRLREELAGEPARDHIVLVLVLFLDERIMQMLPEDLCLSWPMLQREWLGSTHGGDELYRILEHVLAMAEPPPALLEVFYFCLNSGFMGRHAGQPALIEAWKDRLRMTIAARDQAAQAGASDPDESSGQGYLSQAPRSPAWMYLGALSLVAALAVLLLVLSNQLS
jgi:type IV/VI secretion system ImpK/VasF family protein